jgi:hypothetical protein
VTKPSVAGDPLEKAVNAYAKAFQLGAKEKDVDAALQNIVGFYYQDAITAYSLGDLNKASDLFGKAASASMTPPSSKIDTNAVTTPLSPPPTPATSPVPRSSTTSASTSATPLKVPSIRGPPTAPSPTRTPPPRSSSWPTA